MATASITLPLNQAHAIQNALRYLADAKPANYQPTEQLYYGTRAVSITFNDGPMDLREHAVAITNIVNALLFAVGYAQRSDPDGADGPEGYLENAVAGAGLLASLAAAATAASGEQP